MNRIIPEVFAKEQLLRSIGHEKQICTETDWDTLRGTNIIWKTDLRINFEI